MILFQHRDQQCHIFILVVLFWVYMTHISTAPRRGQNDFCTSLFHNVRQPPYELFFDFSSTVILVQYTINIKENHFPRTVSFQFKKVRSFSVDYSFHGHYFSFFQFRHTTV